MLELQAVEDLVGSSLVAESRGSKLTLAVASSEIVEMLRTHCAKGTCTHAGRLLASQRAVLSRALPAVLPWLDDTELVDITASGTRIYAKLIDRPMTRLASPAVSKKSSSGEPRPSTPDEFEREQRLGTYHNAPAPGTRAIDRVESAIILLGWAREHFIEPPHAAKYVTMGLHAFSAFLLLSMAKLAHDHVRYSHLTY